jgi:cysteine-S-conjugate beta-lyase
MKYNFDIFPDRRITESVKWRFYGPDVLPMWVADMDFISPEPVIQALRERIDHGIFGYPEGVAGNPTELQGLRQVIIDRLEERYQWQVESQDLIFLPGVVDGFNLACHTFARPGGRVLVQTPVYPPFLRAPKYASLERVDVKLIQGQDGSYQVDFQVFQDAALDKDTLLFILCNPHNPVGRVFKGPELERMAEACLRNGVVICSDEIHCDLLFEGQQHIPIATLDPEVARHTITLIAPTKTFNIAGLQFSAAIIQNAQLRTSFRKAEKGLVGWNNIMGLTAALAAYRDGQEWLEQLLAYLQGNRDFLYEFVNHELPGIKMGKPEGTYLGWLDCREASLEGGPYEFFLKTAGVALNDGSTFGPGGEGFVRINFGCPRSMLVEALEKMKAALK